MLLRLDWHLLRFENDLTRTQQNVAYLSTEWSLKYITCMWNHGLRIFFSFFLQVRERIWSSSAFTTDAQFSCPSQTLFFFRVTYGDRAANNSLQYPSSILQKFFPLHIQFFSPSMLLCFINCVRVITFVCQWQAHEHKNNTVLFGGAWKGKASSSRGTALSTVTNPSSWFRTASRDFEVTASFYRKMLIIKFSTRKLCLFNNCSNFGERHSVSIYIF